MSRNIVIILLMCSGVVRIFHLWVPKIFRQPQIYILLPKTLKLALNLWDYPKILWVPKYTSQKSVGSAEPTEPPLTTPLFYCIKRAFRHSSRRFNKRSLKLKSMWSLIQQDFPLHRSCFEIIVELVVVRLRFRGWFVNQAESVSSSIIF